MSSSEAPQAGKSANESQSLLEDYFTKDELAQELTKIGQKKKPLSTRTLDRWHTDRRGPPSVRVGNTRLYPKPLARKWLSELALSGHQRGTDRG